MSQEISRRRALQLVVVGGVAVSVAGIGALVRDDGDGSATGAPDGGTDSKSTTGPLPDDPVARIGRRYLDEYPEEADAILLREQLGVAGAAASAIGPQLIPIATADFVAGEIVIIDGWHLSRTEARAAALVALETAG